MMEAVESERIHILICSPEYTIAEYLTATLPGSQFRVIGALPGQTFVNAARRTRPEIAILDRVDDRFMIAQMEVALLKEIVPDVRIIAVSAQSSPSDGTVLESGIYYYLANDWEPVMLDIVNAAVNAIVAQG